ncbi:MAG: aminotransferase class V-fold PLP-dependent enzyme [Actinomycetota bacterium]|nr:aminotransferase class V-fold PLP-dependent enzyme [Actinomycetota bacterium]
MKHNLSQGREIVAIPGPSIIPDRVLSAMHRAMPDIYEGDLTTVIDSVWAGLPKVVQTSGRVFVPIGNGHAAWEMALSNTLSRGDHVLVLNCGRFAAIWAEMAEFNGLNVEVAEAKEGFANEPSALEERLRADVDHKIAAVLTVHVDTATSVRNDVPALRQAIDAAGHPALFMVDCIASMGCERFEMDAWGVDVTIAASQKGMMTPPGLGLVWANDKALSAHESADLRTRYWDWTYRSEDGPYYLRFCGTPPVSHLFGLAEALAMMAEEGWEARWERHRVLADGVRAAVDAWSTPGGIGFIAQREDQRSDSVTSVTTGSIDALELRRLCRQQMGVTLGLGIGSDESASFRIGHMGHVNAPAILGVLGSIETALISMGAPLGASGVQAATAVLSQ